MKARVLITGSRDFGSNQQSGSAQRVTQMMAMKAVEMILKKYVKPDRCMIVHGGARGVDDRASKWALKNEVTQVIVPARWSEYGNAAGIRRNEEMLEDWRPACVIGIWNGRSKGTKHMVDFAIRHNITTLLFTLDLDAIAEIETVGLPNPKVYSTVVELS